MVKMRGRFRPEINVHVYGCTVYVYNYVYGLTDMNVYGDKCVCVGNVEKTVWGEGENLGLLVLDHEFIHHRCTIFIDFIHAITSRERLFKLCKTSMSLDISGVV